MDAMVVVMIFTLLIVVEAWRFRRCLPPHFTVSTEDWGLKSSGRPAGECEKPPSGEGDSDGKGGLS